MGEKIFRSETYAHRIRRQYILDGHQVSLVAFDPSRNRYVFDVLS